METRDISLAGRIIAGFPERLDEDQRIERRPGRAGRAGRDARGQHHQAAEHLGLHPPAEGGDRRAAAARATPCPDYPDDPKTDEERDVRARYDKVMGSAVNPVLRQGNSDRRAPASVKSYARAHPHRMGAVVAGLEDQRRPHGRRRLPLHRAVGRHRRGRRRCASSSSADDGTHDRAARVGAGAGRRGRRRLGHARRRRCASFLAAQIARAKAEGVLFSVHLKATMMKVSDPIIFGHVVRAFFPETFARYGDALAAAGLSPNDGLGRHLRRPRTRCPTARRSGPPSTPSWPTGPALAMVDSDRGITNLHVPSDVIVDASMPAMIRTSGHMWGPDGEEADTLAVIPDSSYAGVYQVVIDDCRAHGAFDPATMGSVPNVGLMAQAAEEYGSHDKTFEIARRRHGPGGRRRRRRSCSSSRSAAGDIFRMCQTKDVPIRDWVKLAVTRARATGDPAVFWLDEGRAHDANLIAKVQAYLPEHDTDGPADRDHVARARPPPSRSSASAGARTPSRSPATCCATT